jgi:uncharacterized Zn finger protein
MPFRPCPECQHQTPRLLEALSHVALVNYFRCEACGHVWHIQKSDPDGPMVAVTVSLPRKPVKDGRLFQRYPEG